MRDCLSDRSRVLGFLVSWWTGSARKCPGAQVSACRCPGFRVQVSRFPRAGVQVSACRCPGFRVPRGHAAAWKPPTGGCVLGLFLGAQLRPHLGFRGSLLGSFWGRFWGPCGSCRGLLKLSDGSTWALVGRRAVLDKASCVRLLVCSFCVRCAGCPNSQHIDHNSC